MPGSLLASFFICYGLFFITALSDTYDYPFITEDEIGAQKVTDKAGV